MLSCRSAGLLVLVALLAGCQGKTQDADASGALSAQGAAEIRERYQRLNPKARVGVVVAVKADANLAAVGEIPVQDFGMGDVLTFINSGERPIASGPVVNATPDALHIRYDVRVRAPRVGDLAVRLPN